MPLIIYCLEINIGLIPSKQVWFAQESNHGPWRDGSLEGLLVVKPLAILLVVTFVHLLKSLFGYKSYQNPKGLSYLLLVLMIQITMIFIQLAYLVWTID